MTQFFLGIGAQKAGTSWLASQLFAHPEVLGSHIKELHVLDSIYDPMSAIDGRAQAIKRRDGVRRNLLESQQAGPKPRETEQRRRFMSATKQKRLERLERLTDVFDAADEVETMTRYRNFFTSALRPEHHAFGEITPAYALLPPRAFEAVLDTFPGARLIFILRDPVDRFLSAMKHRARYGSDSTFDAHRDAASRLDDRNDLLRGRYEATLATLDSVVPPQQVLVVFYEHLFDRRRDEYRRVTDFIGVSPHACDLDQVINVGNEGEFDEDLRRQVARAYSSTYDAISERFSDVPEAWIRNRTDLLGR